MVRISRTVDDLIFYTAKTLTLVLFVRITFVLPLSWRYPQVFPVASHAVLRWFHAHSSTGHGRVDCHAPQGALMVAYANAIAYIYAALLAPTSDVLPAAQPASAT